MERDPHSNRCLLSPESRRLLERKTIIQIIMCQKHISFAVCSVLVPPGLQAVSTYHSHFQLIVLFTQTPAAIQFDLLQQEVWVHETTWSHRHNEELRSREPTNSRTRHWYKQWSSTYLIGSLMQFASQMCSLRIWASGSVLSSIL